MTTCAQSRPLTALGPEGLAALRRRPGTNGPGEVVDAAVLTAFLGLDGPVPDAPGVAGLNERHRADLGADAVRLHLRRRDHSGPVRGFVRLGAEHLLFAREVTSSRGAEHGDYAGPLAVEVLPAGALPIVLARWADLAPTGEVVGETYRLPDAAVLEQRLADAQAPAPDGAVPDLLDAWAQPWTTWSARSDDGAVDLTYVDAGPGGRFAVRRDADGVALVLRPDSLVWGELQQVAVTLHARCGRPDVDAPTW